MTKKNHSFLKDDFHKLDCFNFKRHHKCHKCHKCRKHHQKNNDVKVNLSAFVDVKYGKNSTAEVNNLNKPFRTIKAAINALVKYKNKNKLQLSVAQINLAPGVYPEYVILPANINLVGAGKNAVTIFGLTLKGPTLVSDLTISGTVLPLLKGDFEQVQELVPNFEVFLKHLIIEAQPFFYNTDPRFVIDLVGTGLLQKQIVFCSNLLLSADFSLVFNGGIDTLIRVGNNVDANFVDGAFTLASNLNSLPIAIQSDNGGVVNVVSGGLIIVIVGNSFLQKDVVFYQANPQSLIGVRQMVSVLLGSPELQMFSVSKVIYAKSVFDGRIIVEGSSLNFSPVTELQRVLATTNDPSGKILLQNIESIVGPLPTFNGLPGTIQLLGGDEFGNFYLTGDINFI